MILIGALIVIGVVTWMVASEGVWAAGCVFLCTLLSALLAMNFFEPLAFQLDGMLPPDYRFYSDFLALVGLFIGFIWGLRVGSEYLVPTYVSVPRLMNDVGRWVLGGLTGYLTMAFMLTALHTAPLPRDFQDFHPEQPMFFGMAPDRQWLGFTQYVSEHSLASYYELSKTRERVPHGFDSMRMTVGDPRQPYPNRVWPTFPMRYATRREKGARGLAAAGGNRPATTGTPINTGSAGF